MVRRDQVPALKIAFDQQVFLLQEYGGISRYLCCLAEHLALMPGVEPRVFAPLHFNRSLGAMPRMPGRGILLPKMPTKVFRFISSASKQTARIQIRAFRPDVVHETYFTSEDFLPRGAKRVVTVYDMIFERFAAMIEHGHRTAAPKRAAVMRADHVICISENTRRDLIEITGVPESRTSVVHLAVDEVFFRHGKKAKPPKGLEQPYLLFVGGRQGYKNFGAFLRAFLASEYLRKNFSIVCFGGGELSDQELADAGDLDLKPGQLLHRSGDDHALANCYRSAAALVYPSLYEGFGIPPLEAMACSCPVICSRTSSLPEVVGDAGEYFDPHQEDDMMTTMERVLQSPDRRQHLIAKGLSHCARFSWKKCAEETAEIYRTLL